MKQANAAQRQWMNDIAEWAKDNIHILYGEKWRNHPIQLHHVLGRSAKHNKIAIGHEFIIPVPFDLHDVSSNHFENVTHRKKAFIKRFGLQSHIFQVLVSAMDMELYTTPSSEIYHAIMETKA